MRLFSVFSFRPVRVRSYTSPVCVLLSSASSCLCLEESTRYVLFLPYSFCALPFPHFLSLFFHLCFTGKTLNNTSIIHFYFSYTLYTPYTLHVLKAISLKRRERMVRRGFVRTGCITLLEKVVGAI